MEYIDKEFGEIRKSQIKSDQTNIVKYGITDYEQQEALKKISLFKTPKIVSGHSQDHIISSNPGVISNSGLGQSMKRNLEADIDNDHIIKKSKNSETQLFEELKMHLLNQLNHGLSPNEIPLPSFIEEVSNEVECILKQAIIQKESNSAIIVAPRSHYKTLIIDRHISNLSKEYSKNFIKVTLNGLIHTENAAINSIATQLENELIRIKLDNDINEEIQKNDFNEFQISQGTITEVFDNILKLLDSAAVQMGQKRSHTSKSEKITVVFVFNEIDEFADPVRQTLLYNLFDMVEHARIPVCILGCTTKINILEFLEKRVKSRFSQRIICVPQVSTLNEFLESYKQMITVDADKIKLGQIWNEKINGVLSDDTSELYLLLKYNFDTFKNLTLLKNETIPMIFKAQNIQELLVSIDNCNIAKLYRRSQLQNNLLNKVKSLSDLELIILISAARISLKHDDNVNFNLTYEEYTKIIRSLNAKIPSTTTESTPHLFIERTIRVWNKKDIKNIWESLSGLELISERGLINIRQSAQAAFQATNHFSTTGISPFDLKMFHVLITLQELRKIIGKSSIYYIWTQL